VRLADGTVVTLNTDSRVRINYTGSARRLELLRGELHVAVAPDPARPLSVYAGDRVAQAVGTAFSVELTADRRVELIVTDGKVLFGVRQPRIEPDAASPPLVPETPGTKTLSAGEELVIRGADEVIVPVSPEDMEIKLAWRDGRLIFRDEPLEQAIAEVERYTTIDFVFLDENLKKTLISGRYKTGDVDSLLLSLRANFDIVYEYSGEDRVLLSSL
jgi:transmembrane sensor